MTEPQLTWLAWGGWRLRIPSNWRPLDIENARDKGRVVVGTNEVAGLQVKWWTPEKRFDPAAWGMRRARAIGAGAKLRAGPRPPGFTETVRVRRKGAKPEENMLFWFGFARAARLAVELIVNAGTLDAADLRLLVRHGLPSLRARAPDTATGWSVFDTSFESPPGFFLVERRLNLGDMCLVFRAPNRTRMSLRQVYPASLALARRPIEKWLRDTPFKEYRRYKPAGETEPWQIASFARSLRGWKRRGRKRLSWPLGACAPRVTLTAAAHDEQLDRLLFAEYDAGREYDEAAVAQALGRMNWARFDRAG